MTFGRSTHTTTPHPAAVATTTVIDKSSWSQACHDLPLELYHCFPGLRSYGDGGIAVFVLSTIAVAMCMLLQASILLGRTCYVSKQQIRNTIPWWSRYLQVAHNTILLPVFHVMLVYSSLLQTVGWPVPQLSMEIMLSWLVINVWCVFLLFLTVWSESNRYAIITYLTNGMYLSYIITYMVARAYTAELATDMFVGILMFIIETIVCWHIPNVPKKGTVALEASDNIFMRMVEKVRPQEPPLQTIDIEYDYGEEDDDECVDVREALKTARQQVKNRNAPSDTREHIIDESQSPLLRTTESKKPPPMPDIVDKAN